MQKAVFIGADPQVAEIVRLGICLRWPDVTPLIATTGADGIELVKEKNRTWCCSSQTSRKNRWQRWSGNYANSQMCHWLC